jgi:ligand-binding sensor domain-containing protein
MIGVFSENFRTDPLTSLKGDGQVLKPFGGPVQAETVLLGAARATERQNQRSARAETPVSLHVQDRAGYIWAGSEGGLYRYDGTRIRLMTAAEGLACATEVQALHVAADGALWVNTRARVFRFDGQRFHPIAGLSGDSFGPVRSGPE